MTGGPLYFAFDLGVIFAGTPQTSLTASGTGDVRDNNSGQTRSNVDLGSDPQVQSEVARERNDLQKSIDDTSAAKLFPAISFTLGYRFGL